MPTDLRLAPAPIADASMREAATLGLGVHHLASALHANRNHIAQRDTVGGLVLVTTDDVGAFDGTSLQYVVASNAFIPDAPGAHTLMCTEFVRNAVDRARTLTAATPSRLDVYGVWYAHGVTDATSSAVLYVGNGHWASITWSENGTRSPAIATMAMPPNPPMQRVAVPSIGLDDRVGIADLTDTQCLAVLYNALADHVRAH